MWDKTLEALLYLAKVKNASVKELANAINTSYSNAYRIIKKLESLGFINRVEGGYVIDSLLAMLISNLAAKYPIKLLIRKSAIMVLSAILEPKKLNEIASITDISEHTIRSVLNELLLRGVVVLKDGKYQVVDDPMLRAFLSLMHNIILGVEDYAIVLYRDSRYIIKAVPKNKRAKGSLTAFSVFHKFGIIYESPYDYYIYPHVEVKIEDVIIHALVVSKTADERTIVALLYAKNYEKIDLERLRSLALRFKVLHLVVEMDKYLSGVFSTYFLPYEEFKRLAKQYNVDLSKFESKTLSEDVLEEISKNLEDDATVMLIGGGALILKKLKGMTADIDLVAVSDNDFEKVRRALVKMGYREEKGNWSVFSGGKIRVDLYKKEIPKKFRITNNVISRATERKYGKLRVLIPSDTDLFIMKASSSRPKDLEDLKSLVRSGRVDWKILVDAVKEQDKELKEPISHKVLWTIEELEDTLNVKIPYKKKLKRVVLDDVVPYIYDKMGIKNAREIAKMLRFPEAVIRREIRKMFKESEESNNKK